MLRINTAAVGMSLSTDRDKCAHRAATPPAPLVLATENRQGDRVQPRRQADIDMREGGTVYAPAIFMQE
jgi:hypothetical protein